MENKMKGGKESGEQHETDQISLTKNEFTDRNLDDEEPEKNKQWTSFNCEYHIWITSINCLNYEHQI